ncbi:MAG: radical SAM protein [Candidatus Electryonea clarkiae]|nr:radical SAM protein [Candidatus Electryonea clarkiae]MDP8287419.1 radical SAM protein [Candidatus Electryonea clarkiae]
MRLTGLHLLLTYRCTYECDHCFVFSSPGSEATMTLELIKKAIREAKELGTVEDIYFEGGEPFLYYPVLLAGVKYAKELGFETGIVTNGYFATSIEDAVEWLQPLKEAGLDSLSVSDDDFHGSLDNPDSHPARTQAAAVQLGIDVGAICIEPPKEINDKIKGEPIIGGGVRFRGRAIEKLSDDTLPRKKWDTFTECPDEDFESVGRLHLDPYGYLWSCQGLVFGNLNKSSLKEIIENYSLSQHPVFQPLSYGGPAELVRKYDLDLRGDYLDACHLCYLARKELRKKEGFKDFLAPGQVYGEV